MPYVNIQITKGATREQKSHVVRDVTNSLIQEIAEEDWGFAGILTDDWNKQQVR